MMSSHIDIGMDELFDLDMALTMPDDSTTETELNNRHSDVAQSTAAARVDEMPTVVMDGGAHCTVCMEGFRVGGAGKQVPCAHVFHQNCISLWLSLHNSCPLCRRNIISN